MVPVLANEATGELDFRDGEGVSARYFRLKLAPLPIGEGKSPRCLLSLVDRTVEAQAERALRVEMLRDSLTGLPNRLAFTEKIEQAGETVVEHDVTILAPLNLPSQMAEHASQLYARNIQSLIELFIDDEGALNLDFEDEIIAGACVTQKKETPA